MKTTRLLFVSLVALPALAAVRPAAVFTDGAVLQANRPVPVWGMADPGEKVVVKFAGQTKTAKAGADGTWRVTLDPMAYSSVGRKLIVEQDEKWYDFLMDVNMRSTFLCTREVVPMMTEGGSIVNFSSQAARDGGGPGASMYATAKAAVMCHTRAMAKELGPQGIRVNALAPGMINTSFHDRFTKPAARENLHNTAPLRREGEATEVADLVAFLASEESSYITGTAIDINGGVLFS